MPGKLAGSEVEDLDLPFEGSLDALGLEIAVDDPLLVGFLEGLGDLAGDEEALVEGKGAVLEALRESRALDQLHHQRAHAARFLEAEDPGDVGVLELGEQLRFASPMPPSPTLAVIR